MRISARLPLRLLLAATLFAPLFAAQDAARVVRAEREDGGWTETEVIVDANGNEVPHGRFLHVGPDGETKVVEGSFASGARDGSWRWRDGAGTLRIKGKYEAGERDGKWTFRDAKGTVRAEGNYKRGRKAKDWTFHDDSGAELDDHTGRFEEVRREDAHGDPLYTGFLLDGAPHGRWVVYWETGVPRITAEFVRGRPSGVWDVAHADGTPDPTFPRAMFGERFAWHDVDIEPPPSWLRGGGGPKGIIAPAPTDHPWRDLPRATADRAEAEEIRAEIDAVLDDADPDAAHVASTALVERGADALPHAVNRLLELDLKSVEGAASARRLEERVLTPLVGWRCRFANGGGAEELARNRLAALRWLTIARLVEDNVEFWEIERGNESWDGATTALPIAADLSAIFAAEGLLADTPKRRGGRAYADPLADATAWLTASQDALGFWSCDELKDGACASLGGPRYVVGTTGLAVLALLGQGNSTRSGEHAPAVRAALHWLLSVQQEDGSFGSTLHERRLTDHAVATWALCESVRGSSSVVLRQRVEAALAYLQRARNPYGAWRYAVPPVGSNDTVVTGWALLALSGARNAGSSVDAEAVAGGLAWLRECTDPATGRVGYDSFGSPPARYELNQHFPWERNEGPTAIALHARLAIGDLTAAEELESKQLGLVLRRPPEWDEDSGSIDLHAWYHASVAVQALGGKDARGFRSAASDALLGAQRQDGSWDPAGAWGAFLGRHGATALAMLTLQELAR